MKFIISSSGIETNFSELTDPVAFLDSIRKCEVSIVEVRQNQEEFNTHLKKITIGKKSEKQERHWLILISFLTEETMLLNLQVTMVQ